MSEGKGPYTRLRAQDNACADPGGAALTARGEMLVVNKLAGLVEFYDVASGEKFASLPMGKFPHEVLLSRDHKLDPVGAAAPGGGAVPPDARVVPPGDPERFLWLGAQADGRVLHEGGHHRIYLPEHDHSVPA